MPTPCFMIGPDDKDLRNIPGAMWSATTEDTKHFCSAEFMRDWNGRRSPLFVCLPNGDWHNIDGPTSDGLKDGTRHGWSITGEPPNITVSPSINFVGRWHGWLQNGVLSDDVEGRTFYAVAAYPHPLPTTDQ